MNDEPRPSAPASDDDGKSAGSKPDAAAAEDPRKGIDASPQVGAQDTPHGEPESNISSTDALLPQTDAGLRIADYVVLAVVVAVLATALAYLIRSGVQLEPLLQGAATCGPWAETGGDSICSKTLETQDIVLIATTYGIAWRRNATILIGTCIALVGCLIVLLRVRGAIKTAAAGGNVNLNVATDSAGLFICLLGTMVVAAAALLPMDAAMTVRQPQPFQDPGPEATVPVGMPTLPATGEDAREHQR